MATRIERIRSFTRRFNPLMRPVAARFPGFAIIGYVGRRSGRPYRTPINVFHRDGDYVFALTYGPDVQWVRNVLAAGSAELEERGRIVTLRDPRRISDPAASLVPRMVRPFLRLMRVTEFLRMSPAGGGPDRARKTADMKTERLPKEPLRCCPGEGIRRGGRFCHAPKASITSAAPTTLTLPTHDLDAGAALN